MTIASPAIAGRISFEPMLKIPFAPTAVPASVAERPRT